MEFVLDYVAACGVGEAHAARWKNAWSRLKNQPQPPNRTSRQSLEEQTRRRSEATDADLMAWHAEGDPHAFAELLHRHRDRMWGVALRTLGDPEEAADALQDACLSAFRAAGRFRGDASATTWLHRIVVNACLDRIRRRSARPATSMGDDATFDAVAPKLPDPTDAHGVSLDVRAALEQLPYEQRAALILIDMMGYSVDDAAEVMEVPSGTLKSRRARALKRIAPLLTNLQHPTTYPAGERPSVEPAQHS
ncbi:RNA polymerase sigma factor SigM [Actinomadura opuntiae]|uniref:RNA polymerase sigma factor SigM n=1 Tax=Actinomadura sp. OS1-43 TaxID=604315 RepID=UPI00255B3680|nr:RNA polymerase sigma factor SigM [Actinomadura sp. OS1-43]MDL4818660.1 RNA polymerase sigma factor SigM [Actinomadura sp. OS1-43]